MGVLEEVEFGRYGTVAGVESDDSLRQWVIVDLVGLGSLAEVVVHRGLLSQNLVDIVSVGRFIGFEEGLKITKEGLRWIDNFENRVF